SLQASAQIVHQTESWPDSWYPAFAGPARRQLVLRLRNRSSEAVGPLEVVASVFRGGSAEGSPLMANVDPIPAGETRTISLPFTLAAPVWGDYAVRGNITGLAAPLRFKVRSTNEPWALELAIPLTLLVIAQILRRRERLARNRLELTPPDVPS